MVNKSAKVRVFDVGDTSTSSSVKKNAQTTLKQKRERMFKGVNILTSLSNRMCIPENQKRGEQPVESVIGIQRSECGEQCDV